MKRVGVIANNPTEKYYHAWESMKKILGGCDKINTYGADEILDRMEVELGIADQEYSMVNSAYIIGVFGISRHQLLRERRENRLRFKGRSFGRDGFLYLLKDVVEWAQSRLGLFSPEVRKQIESGSLFAGRGE